MIYNKYMCNYKEHSLENRILDVCKNFYKYFLAKNNVVGIGMGYKVQNSFYTRQKCIQVFVSNKVPKCNLLSNNIVPKLFKGIPTDVIETGVFIPSSLREKIRPVKGGYSVSIEGSSNSGTAGCLVTNGVRKFVLGSNHILANQNLAPIGSEIVQPAYAYGGRTEEVFAKLSKFVPMRPAEGEEGPINFSDAAICELVDSNIMIPDIPYIGRITCVKSPRLGAEVEKVGSTTDKTTGTITSIDSVLRFNYPANRDYIFHDMILTTKMGLGGDSGSILVNKNKCALGMLCGSASTSTSFCKLQTVLDQLDVRLV